MLPPSRRASAVIGRGTIFAQAAFVNLDGRARTVRRLAMANDRGTASDARVGKGWDQVLQSRIQGLTIQWS
jgi:hypothetical protein